MRKLITCAVGFGLAAAVVFFASVADFAYPGESAAILARLAGVGGAQSVAHPLFMAFARLCGGGNMLAPVAGAFGCLLLFAVVGCHVFFRTPKSDRHRDRPALIAAAAATLVFAFTPAVRSAATHLEPRLFDFVWALAGLALALPFALRSTWPVWPCALLMGLVGGLGAHDSVLVTLFVPLEAVVVFRLAARRRCNPFVHVALLAVSFVLSLAAAGLAFAQTPVEVLLASHREIARWMLPKGWMFVLLFAWLPLAVCALAVRRSLNGEGGLSQRFTHVALTFAAILSVATALSPSSLLRPVGILPVASSAAAAATTGYLVAYWWMRRRRAIAVVSGGVLAFVFVANAAWNLFVFDGEAGAFADRLAERVLADLGGRRWLVTDGVIDNHLRLAAVRANRELQLVSLNRDLDRGYLDELAELVGREGLGGEKNAELKLSASLGVLPFLNDWFACDASVKTNVAVWGAPDLWYAAGITPVPELLFFGADERVSPDWTGWKELDVLLKVPKGWGSYRDRGETDPVERLRHALRRHVGLVANDRGVYLQDRGDNDAAWKMYELVLNEIDRDNICAIFNEVAMIGVDHPSAVAKRRDLERMLKAAVDDPKRRYLLWQLGAYYGYIRDPGAFVRLGHEWARSGRPGEALAQIRRAIDIVPDADRVSLMNLMAALYASDNDRVESRRIWQEALSRNSADHAALVGMMQLELKGGDYSKAMDYLERASKAASDSRQAQLDRAMLAMMKRDLPASKAALRKLVDADAKDLQAWSLLAAVVFQQSDASKSEAEKKALDEELESVILPAMERAGVAAENYYVQAVKGFLLLRKGASARREARSAFIAAAKARPDVAASQEMVIGLDISLGDRAGAESHAREILRRNRNAPLANYAMGSIRLGDGKLAEAEVYLRKAADAPRPPPLALNDLAEVLRRTRRFDEAEYYARKAVKAAPKMAAAWDTLGAVLLDADKTLDEAESSVKRACELSKTASGGDGDVRMLVSLARVQLRRGDKLHARVTVRKVEARVQELSAFERREFEAIRDGVR